MLGKHIVHWETPSPHLGKVADSQINADPQARLTQVTWKTDITASQYIPAGKLEDFRSSSKRPGVATTM